MVRALVVLVCLLGCRKEAPVLVIDDELVTRINARMLEVGKGPAGQEAGGALLDAIGSDPAVAIATAGMMADLASDPKIVDPAEQLMVELFDRPEVLAVLEKLVAESPGATDVELRALVGQRFAAMAGSGAISRAVTAGWNVYIVKVSARPEFDTAVAATKSDARVIELLLEHLPRWSARIVALEGKRPSPARAKDIYFEHAWSEARLVQFVTALSKYEALRKHSAKLTADVLSLKSFRRDVQTTLAAVVADPVLRDHAMAVMVDTATESERVTADVVALFSAPELIDYSAKLLARVANNPEVRGVCARWWDAVRSDPSVRAEVDRFLDGW